MHTHLVLLRAVNVSGHNMIKMIELQKALEKIGFTDVKTYIQSGNVFVTTDDADPHSVGYKVKFEIAKTFGHDVPCIVVSKADLQACLTNNPFLKKRDVDTKKLYCGFVSAPLTEYSIHDLKMSNVKPDEVAIDEARMYIKYAISPGKTKLVNKYIEKNLNVFCTIRNWKTVNTLLEMYESIN